MLAWSVTPGRFSSCSSNGPHPSPPPPTPYQTIPLGGGGGWERQTPDHIYIYIYTYIRTHTHTYRGLESVLLLFLRVSYYSYAIRSIPENPFPFATPHNYMVPVSNCKSHMIEIHRPCTVGEEAHGMYGYLSNTSS